MRKNLNSNRSNIKYMIMDKTRKKDCTYMIHACVNIVLLSNIYTNATTKIELFKYI